MSGWRRFCLVRRDCSKQRDALKGLTVNPQTSLANLPGAQVLIDWFGVWPSFHDAEVISIELNRESASKLRIHYFSTSNRTNERGYYITEKHAIVSFIMEDIAQLQLTDFNQQNVLSSISVTPIETKYEIILGDCYGVSGRILASKLCFELEPGMPNKSVYAETIS